MAESNRSVEETTDPATPMTAFARALTNLSRDAITAPSRMYSQMLAANQEAMQEIRDDEPDISSAARADSDIDALAYSGGDWEVERSIADKDQPSVDDWVRFSKPIGQNEVEQFAAASGDTNRLHLDDGFASKTRFGRRIVHGTLVSGLISAALARFPGLTIYLSQDLSFKRPADIGQRLTAEVRIVEALGDDRYRLTTTVSNDDATLVDGEAVVLIDDCPEGEC